MTNAKLFVLMTPCCFPDEEGICGGKENRPGFTLREHGGVCSWPQWHKLLSPKPVLQHWTEAVAASVTSASKGIDDISYLKGLL